MKKSNGKKIQKSGGKRTNKTQSKKAIKGSGKNSKQTGRKTANSRNTRNVKRNSALGFSQLSKTEREIYRTFETLLKQDEKASKVKGAEAKRKRSKGQTNLFVIPLPQKGMQAKINALRNAKFKNIETYLKRQDVEPLYVYCTLKIKKPKEPGYYFNGGISPITMVVNLENTKNFMIETLIDYNNDSIDAIQEQTHSSELNNGKVYNVIEMSVRFLYYNR